MIGYKQKDSIENMESKRLLRERIICKLTSGRFIMTCVVAGVYAYLACSGMLPIDRVMEVTLVVLYAYFTKERK